VEDIKCIKRKKLPRRMQCQYSPVNVHKKRNTPIPATKKLTEKKENKREKKTGRGERGCMYDLE
jgi:hypothetical protein